MWIKANIAGDVTQELWFPMVGVLIWQAIAWAVYACKESGWAGDWIWLTIRFPPQDNATFHGSGTQ